MKKLKFAFVNDAAESEYKNLPDSIQDEFGADFKRIQFDEPTRLPIAYLNGIGPGVVELKKNGSPAFRSVFISKYADTIVVLHSFSKTTNGTDQKAMRTATNRYKELLIELRKLGVIK